MLNYNRIDASEGTYVTIASKSKECITCFHWYFVDNGFGFQSTVSDGSHIVLMISWYDDALMISTDIKNKAFLDIYGLDYCCIIFGVIKSKAINLVKNLVKKLDICRIWKNFLLSLLI